MKNYRVIINPDECKGCERCVISCPRKVLEMGSKLNKMSYAFAHYTGSGCIGCKSCYYTCPEPGAVTIWEINDEKNQ